VTVLEAVEAIPRLAVHAVTVTACNGRCTVSVEVRRGDDHGVAILEGVLAAPIARRLVADATLQALATLDPAAASFGVDAVTVAPVGSELVSTVTMIDARNGRASMIAAAGVVGLAGEHDAISRVVLEHTSRLLLDG
jgi:hypothetical protein